MEDIMKKMLLIFCAMSIGWLSGMGQLQTRQQEDNELKKNSIRESFISILLGSSANFEYLGAPYKDDVCAVLNYGYGDFFKNLEPSFWRWFNAKSIIHIRGRIQNQGQDQRLPAEMFNEVVKKGKTTCFYDLQSINNIEKCVFPEDSTIKLMNPSITIQAQVEDIEKMIQASDFSKNTQTNPSMTVKGRIKAIEITIQASDFSEIIQRRKDMLGIEYDTACKEAKVLDKKAFENTKKLKKALSIEVERYNTNAATEVARIYNEKLSRQTVKSGLFAGFFGMFMWAVNPVLYAFNYCNMCSSLTDFWTRTLFTGVTTGLAYMLASKKLFPFSYIPVHVPYKPARVVAEWEEQEEKDELEK